LLADRTGQRRARQQVQALPAEARGVQRPARHGPVDARAGCVAGDVAPPLLLVVRRPAVGLALVVVQQQRL